MSREAVDASDCVQKCLGPDVFQVVTQRDLLKMWSLLSPPNDRVGTSGARPVICYTETSP